MTPETRLRELQLELPPVPPPGGVYQPVVIVDRLAFISGHLPVRSDGSVIIGRVGADVDTAAAKLAARQVGLTLLATLRAQLGSLDRVRRLVRLFGMVNATPGFGEHAQVINGCSELFRELWGPELGVGARSAVGMGSLPRGAAVEIEGIFELHSG